MSKFGIIITNIGSSIEILNYLLIKMVIYISGIENDKNRRAGLINRN